MAAADNQSELELIDHESVPAVRPVEGRPWSSVVLALALLAVLAAGTIFLTGDQSPMQAISGSQDSWRAAAGAQSVALDSPACQPVSSCNNDVLFINCDTSGFCRQIAGPPATGLHSCRCMDTRPVAAPGPGAAISDGHGPYWRIVPTGCCLLLAPPS